MTYFERSRHPFLYLYIHSCKIMQTYFMLSRINIYFLLVTELLATIAAVRIPFMFSKPSEYFARKSQYVPVFALEFHDRHRRVRSLALPADAEYVESGSTYQLFVRPAPPRASERDALQAQGQVAPRGNKPCLNQVAVEFSSMPVHSKVAKADARGLRDICCRLGRLSSRVAASYK